jgi:hypothetical protein
MQAIALVTGDEFLGPYNFTIPTDDVLVYMRELFTPWIIDGITKTAVFERSYAASLTSIVSHAGFCHNFNMVAAEELLNFDSFETTFDFLDDFHLKSLSGFLKSSTTRLQITPSGVQRQHTQRHSQNSNEKIQLAW